eukprot:2602669-Pyramimonas_sp.AAC.1
MQETQPFAPRGKSAACCAHQSRVAHRLHAAGLGASPAEQIMPVSSGYCTILHVEESGGNSIFIVEETLRR